MQNNTHPIKSQPQGFALIATISVMVLMVMIALAMLSLSTIELRQSGNTRYQQEAQANARMALMIAIGELQQNAGVDQRITARGGIMEGGSSTPVNHPYLTGVWHSKHWDPSSTRTPPADLYKKGRASDGGTFVKYLVSEKEYATLENPEFALSGNFTDPVELAPGGIASLNEPITAGRIPTTSGAYAFAVVDQGVAADISLRKKNPQNSQLLDRATASFSAIRSGANAVENLDQYPADSTDLDKLATNGQSSLIFPDSASQDIAKGLRHDLTSKSLGLLTDAVWGGGKKDLNSLLDLGSLPAQYQTATGSETSADTATNRLLFMPPWAGSAEWKLASVPNWEFVQDFYSLPSDMATHSSGLPSLLQTSNINPRKRDVYSRNFQGRGLFFARQVSARPVMSRLQLVMSMKTEQLPDDGSGSSRYRTRLYMDPVITMWNPYNVVSVVPQLETPMFIPPMKLNFTVGGTTSEFHLDQRFVHTRFEIGRRSGGGSQVTILKPGATVVYSGFSWHGHHNCSITSLSELNPNSYANDAHQGTLPGWSYPRNRGSYSNTLGIPSKGYSLEGTSNQMLEMTVNFETNPDNSRPDFRIGQGDAGAWPPSNTPPQGKHDIWRGSDRTNLLVAGAKSGIEKLLHRMAPTWVDIDVNSQLTEKFNNESSKIPQRSLASLTTKTPFAVLNVQLKTTEDAVFPNQMWAHSDPQGAHTRIKEPSLASYSLSPYEIELIAIPSGAEADIPVEIDTGNGNSGFVGTSYTASGLDKLVHTEYPLAPLSSLVQLRHLPAPYCNYGSSVKMLIGESFAHPMIPADAISPDISGSPTDDDYICDRTYLANNTLFDHYFCSSAAAWEGAFLSTKGTAKSYKTWLDDLFDKNDPNPLPNARYIAYGDNASGAVVGELTSGDLPSSDAYKKISMKLMAKGMFNVNSTSKEAWASVLNGLMGEQVEILNLLSSSFTTDSGDSQPMHRYMFPSGNAVGSSAGASDHVVWRGYTRLDEAQIRELAEKIVEEVKSRGPFLSMSEFINRRLKPLPSDTTATNSGAIQAAIDKTDINEILDQSSVPTVTGYRNAAAAEGSSARGLPGYLTQADVLSSLAPYISVRSDTFVIYAYGESADLQGKVLSRAWCSATVQRIPEYLDSSNPADAEVVDSSGVPITNALSELNQKMGRRFKILNFRWLNKDEIASS